jgi:hypothetical protein
MKKLYTLLFLAVASIASAQTFYSENFGTAAPSSSPYPAIGTYTGFQNPSPIVYSGTCSARTSGTLSTGYNGASGGSHVYMGVTSSVGQILQIDGLNTSAYTAANIQLSFGYLKNGATNPQLVVEQSTDGSTWTPVTFTDNTNTSWNLVTVTGGQIPSSTTLSLRFTNPSTASAQIRLDDIKLSNVSASCTLSLGTATTLCDASTLNIDTYTVTIPYTGGGNATYTITPSSGTVGGDNPSTVAAGNIVVSGIAEGTNFTMQVTGGTCTLEANANAPECKPINDLPFSDAFNYTVGTALNTQQKWTTANSGDAITINTGSLNYSGFTSSGNSITFSGSGAESFTPFTSTTSGTIFASFIVSVTDIANITADPSATYFAGLTDGSTGGYNARLFFNRVGTQYQFGFDSASTTTNYDATLRNVGDVVFVVMGYDFNTNTLNAWINPDLNTFSETTPATLTVTPTTAPTAFGGFIFRQDGSATTPTVVADELRIATTVSQLLAVSQNSIKGLAVYPNPATHGVLYVETAANAERTIAIYDVLGKNVLNTTTSNSEVNISALKGGVYIVKITEEGKTATRKLIIK